VCCQHEHKDHPLKSSLCSFWQHTKGSGSMSSPTLPRFVFILPDRVPPWTWQPNSIARTVPSVKCWFRLCTTLEGAIWQRQGCRLLVPTRGDRLLSVTGDYQRLRPRDANAGRAGRSTLTRF
jgi:hypothetical protein